MSNKNLETPIQDFLFRNWNFCQRWIISPLLVSQYFIAPYWFQTKPARNPLDTWKHRKFEYILWVYYCTLSLHFDEKKISQQNTPQNSPHGNVALLTTFYLHTVAICIVSIYFDEKNFPTVVCHGVTYIEGVRRYRIWRSKNFHFIEIVFYWLKSQKSLKFFKL